MFPSRGSPMGAIKVSALVSVLVSGLACVASAAPVEEILPERFLPPRDFNPHPYETGDFSGGHQGGNRDVTFPERLASGTRIDPEVAVLGPDPHPYALLARKRPREGRYQHHRDGERVIYPHPVSVLEKIHKKGASASPASPARDTLLKDADKDPFTLHAHEQELQGILYQPPTPILEDQRIDGPVQEESQYHHQQNDDTPVYAFSYLVKGDRPGDHYSHAQQHSESGTRGQYRVRLPDGRLQIVSYVADDAGYNAVVRYDENGGDAAEEPVGHPQPQPQPQADNPNINDVAYNHRHAASQPHSLSPAVSTSAPQAPGHFYTHGVSSTGSPSFSLLDDDARSHHTYYGESDNSVPIDYPDLSLPRSTVAPVAHYSNVDTRVSLQPRATPASFHLHPGFVNPVQLNRLLQQDGRSK